MTIRQTRTMGVLLMTVALLLTAVSVQPADAHVGEEGCTPGYWKNHTDSWPSSYAPSTPLKTAFWFLDPAAPNLQDQTWDDAYHGFADDTMLEALGYGGGPGLDGATRILLRAATAALLNVDAEVAYITVNKPQIVKMVRDALKTQDRATIIAMAEWLDDANNSEDGCPLN